MEPRKHRRVESTPQDTRDLSSVRHKTPPTIPSQLSPEAPDCTGSLGRVHSGPMARLFIAQEQLDSWVMEETAQLEATRLHWDGRVFQIEEAVRFLSVVGDEADAHDLLGRVKTTAQLTQLSAEHYMDSVLLGDTGYEVQQGFIAIAES